MRFKDPKMQARLEQLNSEGLSLESLVQDFNVARVCLEEALAEGCEGNPMQWSQNVVNMTAQLSRAGDQLLKTAERLNLVLDKEALHKLSATIVDLLTTIVRDEVGGRAHERIVDRLAPALTKAIAEARN